MNLLVKNIGMLVGIDESGRLKVEGKAMADVATLENAWLLTDGDEHTYIFNEQVHSR